MATSLRRGRTGIHEFLHRESSIIHVRHVASPTTIPSLYKRVVKIVCRLFWRPHQCAVVNMHNAEVRFIPVEPFYKACHEPKVVTETGKFTLEWNLPKLTIKLQA